MRFLSTLVSLFFFGSVAVAVLAFLVVLHYSIGLPDYRQLENYEPPITTRLYANDGSLLMEYATEKRTFVPVDKIPTRLKQAFLSAEDKTFYEHGGIDLTGLLRAIFVNVQNFGKNRRPVGASTITQQVAKNFLLSSDRTLARKIKEALLARKIEKTFSKDHILELYLNEIYLGLGSYGVASAALNYFDKSMNELTLGEAAYLAALPKAPNNYHPERHPEAAKERRDYVLQQMLANGYITEEEMTAAMEEPIKLNRRTKKLTKDGQYYAEEVRRFVVNKMGENSIYLGGLSIRTGLDPNLQNYAVQALQDGLIAHDRKHGWRGPVAHFDANGREELKQYEKEYAPKDWEYALVESVADDKAGIYLMDGTEVFIPFSEMTWAKQALEKGRISINEVKKVSDVLKVGDVILTSRKKDGVYTLQQMPLAEAALVAIDPHTGRVLAMQGGFAFERNQFNRAVQAYRQPGSSFKPFVYTAALDSGYTPSSLILDAPIVMENVDGTKWKPENYSKQFYGPTTLRVGIEKSRNLMTIRLAQAIGMKKVLEYGKKFNISDHLERNLATALGAGETTLLRLTAAYGMLVNGGKKITPIFIDRIQDRNGKTIYKADERVCDNCVGAEASASNQPIIPDDREQIQDPASAYQMVNILTGVILRGTGSVVRPLKRNLGGKSGTSNDNIDAWFIGFSPDLVVGVWVGKDNPEPLGPHDTGGGVAAPIFRDFMKMALADKPDVPFRVPDSVKLVRVNATTGKPAKAGDTNVIMEAFRLDTDLSKPEKVVGKDITLHSDDDTTPDLGGIY